jgi:hypothetical protein
MLGHEIYLSILEALKKVLKWNLWWHLDEKCLDTIGDLSYPPNLHWLCEVLQKPFLTSRLSQQALEEIESVLIWKELF